MTRFHARFRAFRAYGHGSGCEPVLRGAELFGGRVSSVLVGYRVVQGGAVQGQYGTRAPHGGGRVHIRGAMKRPRGAIMAHLAVIDS